MKTRRAAVGVVLMVLLAACTAAPIQPTPTSSPSSSAPPSASATVAPTATAAPTDTPSPSQAPTETPTPTDSASASASPSATAGASALDEAEIARHLDAFEEIATNNDGRRAAGTSGYDASTDYVADQLETLGWQVERNPFDFTFFDEAAPVELIIGAETWSGPEWLHAMIYSAPGDVSGTLQTVGIAGGQPTETGGCDAADWGTFSAGNVALVLSGPCLKRDQVLLAQDAGAAAIIGLYPTWGANQIRRPTLIVPDGIEIPAIVAGLEPATALLAAAETGGNVEIVVEVEMSPTTNDNIVAELRGASPEVVMLGAHLDSVLDGPGLNDNASGSAALLAMAAALSQQAQPAQTIRMAFWGAEELGTHGSRAYVDGLSAADREAIQAYLNLDMVASVNPARYVYDNELAPAGSDDITQALLDALDALGAPGLPVDLGGGSDHAGFEAAGIPSGGV
ncbi:MAG TPA: M20/M25/M40 family metallo-hydrolase, partial [Candidatus Limnocylindrales bacterium]|nr:M20/M25/M40 family metallo-hydrolase [Candidatus Limnocylindrales bacterium]